MDDKAPELQFELLPTGKPHISFSEIREWKDCSFRHKLRFVQGIDLGTPGPAMDFGTAAHASCEAFLPTRVMDETIAHKKIDELWALNAHHKGYDVTGIAGYKEQASAVLAEVPVFMDTQFPGWECIDAEHKLYEPVEGHPHAFKGFIDAVIKAKGKRGEDIVWLIDWKTTSWGWGSDKKTDDMVRAQLVLYKNFWSKKTDTDPKNVRCGFVLLKRTAKVGQKIELVPVSVGDVTTERSLKIVNNMLSSVKKGISIKNRASCKYCPFKDTEHCT